MLPLVNDDGLPISEDDVDLTKGEIREVTIPKPGAYDTIDNVTKFALDDDDYMEVRQYHVWNDLDYQVFAQAEQNAQNERLIQGLFDFEASTDDTICHLYEQILEHAATNDEQDAAICDLYEQLIGAIS